MIKKTLNKIKDKSVTPVIDMILGKTMSKKLMVFMIATAFVATKYLTGEEWIDMAKFYVGVQGTVDVVKVIKGTYQDKSDTFKEEESR